MRSVRSEGFRFAKRAVQRAKEWIAQYERTGDDYYLKCAWYAVKHANQIAEAM